MPFSRLSPQNDCVQVTMKTESVRGSKAKDLKIEALRLDHLRKAIRSNRVSFPAQVPVFEKHDRPDLQRKVVQLYFVLGWSCSSIGDRYGLIRQRVQQILNIWKKRAVEMGYVQHIPPAEDLVQLFEMAEQSGVAVPARLPSIPNFLPPATTLPEIPQSL